MAERLLGCRACKLAALERVRRGFTAAGLIDKKRVLGFDYSAEPPSRRKP